MKEKEIHLTAEEIDYLLKGTIHWEDIASRTAGSLRKPMDLGKTSPKESEKIGVQEKDPSQREAFYRESLSGSPGREFKHNEKGWEDLKLHEDMKEDCVEENPPFWSGAKVYILLSLTGCITLGTWAYFVFA